MIGNLATKPLIAGSRPHTTGNKQVSVSLLASKEDRQAIQLIWRSQSPMEEDSVRIHWSPDRFYQRIRDEAKSFTQDELLERDLFKWPCRYAFAIPCQVVLVRH